MSLWNNWYNTFNNPFAYWNSPFTTADSRWLNTGVFGVDEVFGYGDPRFGFRSNVLTNNTFGFGFPTVGFGVNPFFGGIQNVNPFFGNTLGCNVPGIGFNPIFSNWNDIVRYGYGINSFGQFPTVNGFGVSPFYGGFQIVNPFYGYGNVANSFGFPIGNVQTSYGYGAPSFGGVNFGYTPSFGSVNYGYGYPTTNTWNNVPYGSGYFTGGGIGNEWRGNVTNYPQNGTLVGSIDNRR